MNFRLFFVRLLCVTYAQVLLSAVACGEFYVTIGSEVGLGQSTGLTVSRGSKATLGVYLYNASNSTVTGVTNIGLAFDISASTSSYDGNAGFEQVFPEAFSINILPQFIDAGSNVDGPSQVGSASGIEEHEYDVFANINLSSSGVTSFAGQGVNPLSLVNSVHVANISFTVPQQLEAGKTYGFKFKPNAAFTGPGDIVNFLNGENLLAGSGIGNINQFTITAVPEPSSLALIGLVSVGMCLARRRRASV